MIETVLSCFSMVRRPHSSKISGVCRNEAFRERTVRSQRDSALIRICLLLIVIIASVHSCRAADRPNILIVLTDDLGYGDLGCYGNAELRTPHVDRFAAEGLRLTSCYAGHANCSPSRTALMTGRTPTRAGIRNWIPEESPVHLRSSEITIATLLRNAGYNTCVSGKWHLNGRLNSPEQPQPHDHGFDHWFVTQNNALPNHKNPNNFVRNGEAAGSLEGYAAQLVVDEAITWLKDQRDSGEPFLLFVSIHEPHEPIATADRYSALYPSEDPSYSAHHGNISQMDDAFGRLMLALDERELRDQTFVFFTSDNGPAITAFHPHGSAGPLRDKKGSLYEGGIRVPGIIRWPGHTVPGTISDEPVCGVDLLPTLCDLAGIQPPQDRRLDGASLLPIFEDRPIERQTPLYWHFNQSTGEPKVALRVGDWKLLATLDTPPATRGNDLTDDEQHRFRTAKLDRFLLYNLKADIGESADLCAAEPEKLRELQAIMQQKYDEVRTESPMWPEWQFTGAEGRKIVWPGYSRRRKQE